MSRRICKNSGLEEFLRGREDVWPAGWPAEGSPQKLYFLMISLFSELELLLELELESAQVPRAQKLSTRRRPKGLSGLLNERARV